LHDAFTKIENTLCSQQTSQSTILLAVVKLSDKNGNTILCRALLDSGAQSNYVTENICQRLKLQKTKTNVLISGFGAVEQTIKNKTEATIQSRLNHYQEQIQFLVTSKITDILPAVTIKHESWNIPSKIKLADPEFYKPRKIDMLLGAELFFDIMENGQIILDNDLSGFER
jgi:hypothetical protein